MAGVDAKMDTLQSPQNSNPVQEQSLTPRPTSSPPTSSSSSPKSVSQRRSACQLSLDLDAIPPLTQPASPSNTLLITQLNDPTVFHPASLATVRQHITSISPLYSFSPLKSFRRIVCSFYDTQSAISVRQHLDGAALLDNVRARVYFGEPTPIGEQKKYLDRPDAGRLFFISPPPSPPVGWQVREEDPPNKDVHPSDLAQALGKLRGKMEKVDVEEFSPVDRENISMSEATMDQDGDDLKARPPLHISSPANDDASGSKQPSAEVANNVRNRSRSSTIIYDPEAHGDSSALPAVMVEDTTVDDVGSDSGEEEHHANLAANLDGTPSEGKSTIIHTSRPPVELMENA